MKKLFLSAIAAAALFSACSSSDDAVDNGVNGPKGELKAEISFQGVASSTRAAQSTAIPPTTWANIKDLKMFLVSNATSKVSLAKDITIPASPGASFTETWTGVPAGTYNVVLIANSKPQATGSTISNIISGTSTPWTQTNVITKGITGATPDIYLGLAQTTAPTGAVFTAAGIVPFSEPTEVFTAYSTAPVTVAASTPASVTGLDLKRQVAMMRVRINQDAKNAQGIAYNSGVDLVVDPGADSKLNILSIARQPSVAYAFQSGAFKGGLPTGSVFSDTKAILVATGAGIYSKSEPSYATGGKKVLTGDFKAYRDVIVFPNMEVSSLATTSAALNTQTAIADNKYWIQVSAVAPIGYVPVNAQGVDQPALTKKTVVYWAAPIEHVFAPNYIREVNLSLIKPGSIDVLDPQETGNLKIEVGTPEQWNSNILDSNIDM